MRCIIILFVLFLCFAGCGIKKTITERTYITDKESEKKWDSIFTSHLSYTFEQFQKIQKERLEQNSKDSSYVKDSTVIKVDPDGNKIGEDRYHYESHFRSEKEYRQLQDSVSYYKTYMDSLSLYRAKLDSSSKMSDYKVTNIEYKEKSLSKLQKVFMTTGQMFYFCLILIIVYIIYRYKVKDKL